MNIQKTNLLLLNNKFKMRDNAPAPVANPVSDESSAKNVMNALMAQGQQNYLNNNVAFQGGMKQKIGTYAATLLLGAAALATTSCTKKEVVEDRQPVVVNVETNVSVDFKSLDLLLAEIKALREDMNNQSTEYKQQFQQIINMFQTFIDMYKNNEATDEKFKQEIINNQNAIIALLEMQGVNQEEALKLLNKILNSNMTMEEILNAIKGLVSDIKSQLNTIISNQEAAAKDRAALLEYVKGIAVNSNTLVYIGEQALKNDSITHAQLDILIQKVEAMNIDMNANSEALSEQLGIQHSQLITLLINIGYSMAQIEKMTAAQIIAAIKENTAVAKESDAKLAEIIEMLKNGQITAEEARDKILELLSSIDAKLGALLDVAQQTLDEIKAFKKEQADNMAILIDGQKVNGDKLDILIELNKKEAESLANLEIKGDTIIAKFDEIKGQGAGVDYDKLKAIADELGLNIINANKAMFEQALETYLKAHKEDNDLLKAIYEKLSTLEGTTINKTDLKEAIAELVLNINNGTDDITGAIKDLQAKLDEIIAKLQAIYDKMCEFADAANEKWDKIDGYFNKIINLLEEGNGNTSQLLVQFKLARTTIEKMQADLEKLEAAAEQIKDDEAKQVVLQTEIKELLENLNIDPSKYETIKELLEACKEKLIIIAEKEWKCECNCQHGNNEGIIEELQGITG